jgi:penicillin-binding protein 2
MASSDAILGMFHRRLLMLGGAALVGLCILLAQLGRLTIANGAELRDRAEARLVTERWTPTSRGRILDRKGRVLAQDRPSFSLVAQYDVISGIWAREKGWRAARKTFRENWRSLDEWQRGAAARPFIEAYEAHLERAWETIGKATARGRDGIEEKRREVMAIVERIAASQRQRQFLNEVEDRLERGRELTEQFEDDLSRRIDRNKVAEEQEPHTIVRALDDGAGFELQRLLAERGVVEVRGTSDGGVVWSEEVDRLPRMSVTDTGDREYPYESLKVEVDLSTLPSPVRAERHVVVPIAGVAAHVLGWLRGRVQQEDLEARAGLTRRDESFRLLTHATNVQGRLVDRGRYMPSDATGGAGIERSQESALRGLRGLTSRRLDTGQESTLQASPGTDVQLTLDVMLQARIHAAMQPEVGLAAVQPWHRPPGEPAHDMMPDGTPLFGATVVLDIETGEILAMVSTPSFTRQQREQDPKSVFSDPIRQAGVNRAIAVPYQPGSIVKALILTGAVRLSAHDLSLPIECHGHLFPNRPDQLRCWIFKNPQLNTTHQAVFGRGLSASEALMVSCNIYFYTLGQRLGPGGIAKVYRMFGLGESFTLGLDSEFRGTAGRDETGAGLEMGDAIFMGIGQGPVAWTPVHAADAYATIARGGTRLRPSLIRQRGETLSLASERSELGLTRDSVDAALQGLDWAVNDPQGTGHHITIGDERLPHFNCPGVRVWGKTGTADASPLVVDPDGSEGPLPPRVVRDGDHSWFVVLAGPEGGRPKYAIAVVMEYAGSGGKVSGPIVNQILYALRAEGYF